MRAMILEAPKRPLKLVTLPKPIPNNQQVLIHVHACAVCRTDLHIIDGELPPPHLPLIMGHQIVGTIEEMGKDVKHFNRGDRVGVPWLGSACGHCAQCASGKENLCKEGLFTGYQLNGGFAEYCVADSRFIFPIPFLYSDIQAAPLLCGGLIGYRAYRMTGNANTIGFYGFGSAAHILIQLAVYEKRKVYAFTRKGDLKGQEFAKSLGAVWAGCSEEIPPHKLDAAILFAPAGELVPYALQAIEKGGKVICAGIHMSPIPSFSYDLLYGEKILTSVTNLTRKDGEEFLKLAPQVPIHTKVNEYSLEEANQALDDLKKGRITGTAVLKVATKGL